MDFLCCSQTHYPANEHRGNKQAYRISRLFSKSRALGVQRNTTGQKGGSDGSHSPLYESVSPRIHPRKQEVEQTCFSIGRNDILAENTKPMERKTHRERCEEVTMFCSGGFSREK